MSDGRSSLAQDFGNVIRSRRRAIGLSQEALADAAGVHRTYVSLIERGQRTASIDVVAKLAGALRTTMTELMRDLEGPR